MRFYLSKDFKNYILSKVKERNSKTSASAIYQWTEIKIKFKLEDKDIENIIKETVLKNEKITWEQIQKYCIENYLKEKV